MVGAGWSDGVGDSAGWVRQSASSGWDWDSSAGAGRHRDASTSSSRRRDASAGSSRNDSEGGASSGWDTGGSWQWQISAAREVEHVEPVERSGGDGAGKAKEDDGGELHFDEEGLCFYFYFVFLFSAVPGLIFALEEKEEKNEWTF